ncbi:MAG: LPS assembly lipoprotein LptE [Pseudomonadota bacterium]
MSSSEAKSRRAVLRLGLLGAATPMLAGCFRPMLAEGGAAEGIRGRVALPAVGGRLGYVMNETFESRLGRPGQTQYRLEVSTTIDDRGLLVAQDNTVTREQLRATAVMRLYRNGEVEPVLQDLLVSEAGFDETASLYASRTTRRDIEERLARDLAERISRRVLARASQLEGTG